MCLILADVLKYADNKVLERMSINYQIMEYSIDVSVGCSCYLLRLPFVFQSVPYVHSFLKERQAVVYDSAIESCISWC